MSKVSDTYIYNPLPHNLTIKESDVNGLGLFAKKLIPRNEKLGICYYLINNKLFHTPIGGFINGTNNPNCIVEKNAEDNYELITLRIIQKDEELVINYDAVPCLINNY